MGTKPAKVTHRPSWPTKAAKPANIQLYPVYPVYPAIAGYSWIQLDTAGYVAKVGPLRARVKSAKVRPTPYVYYRLVG